MEWKSTSPKRFGNQHSSKYIYFLCSEVIFALSPKSSLQYFTNNPFTKQIIAFVFMFFPKSDNFVAWNTWSYKLLLYGKVAFSVVTRWRGDGKKVCKWLLRGKKKNDKKDEQTTNDTSQREEVESDCDVSRWSVNTYLRLEQQIANSDKKCNSARKTYAHWSLSAIALTGPL